MVIDIDKKTIDYIKEKGGVINIDLFTAGSCCIEITEPVVNFSIPDKVFQFDEYDIEGIKIFVSKFIHMRDEKLTIKLKSLIGIKTISLSGTRLL